MVEADEDGRGMSGVVNAQESQIVGDPAGWSILTMEGFGFYTE